MTESCISSSLSISDFELPVFLGWTEQERSEAQIVLLSFKIIMRQTPQACVSDQLADTYCYAQLIQKIEQQIAGQRFQLIEHLALTIHTCIKQSINENDRVRVTIKKHPKIAGLNGYAAFHYSGS